MSGSTPPADERREFWANIEGLFSAGGPLAFPLALWGALLAYAGASRQWLRLLRDATTGCASFLMLVALVPAALQWLPWQVALPAAAALAGILTTWIVWRNRRTSASPNS